jgi:hypothetical protein
VAVTPATPDPLTAQFLGDLRTRGVHVSSDVGAQLTGDASPARMKKATRSGATTRLSKK